MDKKNFFLSTLPFSPWAVCRSSSKNTKRESLIPVFNKNSPRAHTESELGVLGVHWKLVKYVVHSSKRRKEKNSHQLPKQQSTSFWSLGVKLMALMQKIYIFWNNALCTASLEVPWNIQRLLAWVLLWWGGLQMLLQDCSDMAATFKDTSEVTRVGKRWALADHKCPHCLSFAVGKVDIADSWRLLKENNRWANKLDWRSSGC
jgi:hypothetical protein